MRACTGTANFPHIEVKTRRYRYCFETLPTQPWLVVFAPAAALLLAGAAVIRRHRFIAWVFVLALSVALLIYVDHVSEMNGNLTI